MTLDRHKLEFLVKGWYPKLSLMDAAFKAYNAFQLTTSEYCCVMGLADPTSESEKSLDSQEI